MNDYSVDPELIQHLRDGQEEYFPVLWNKVKRFVYKKANEIMSYSKHWVQMDDLEQAGRLALWRTVQAWDPEKGKFFDLFAWKLKNELRIACNCLTPKQAKDPLRSSLSLDETIPGTDDTCTLGELIPDPYSAEQFEDIEYRIWIQELHSALDHSMEKLPERSADVLRQHYYVNRTAGEIAARMDVCTNRVQQMEYKALRIMRRDKTLQAFVEEHTPSMSIHRGINTFKRTHISATEWLVLERERIAEWFAQRGSNVQG